MLTINELKQVLIERMDEVTFLDLLEISTEDLVNVFQDKIEDRYDILIEEVDDDMERDFPTD